MTYQIIKKFYEVVTSNIYLVNYVFNLLSTNLTSSISMNK